MIVAALIGLVHARIYLSEVQRTMGQWSEDVYVQRRWIRQRVGQSTPYYLTDMAPSAMCHQHRLQTRPVCMQFGQLSCPIMRIVDSSKGIARGLYIQVQGPPTLIVADLNVIVCLSLSCKFHLGRCCDGGRITVDWPVPVHCKKS